MSRRQTVMLSATLAIISGLLLNVLSARHHQRWDWTQASVYTLSERSLELVAGLDREVELIALMDPLSPFYDQVDELLDRYAQASPRLRIEVVDPNRQVLRTQKLAARYQIEVSDTLVVASGARSEQIRLEEMAILERSERGEIERIRAFAGEARISSSIRSVTAGSTPRIYLLGGHGEVDPGSEDMGGRSVQRLLAAARRDNLDLVELETLLGGIPEDAAALAILGPSAHFTPDELERLELWLGAGGHLLLSLDPVFEPDGDDLGLLALLEGWGVRVSDSLVVDPAQRDLADLSALSLQITTSHPITERLVNQRLHLPLARGLVAQAEAGLVAEELVVTSPGGWAETDLAGLIAGLPVSFDSDDLAGPVAIAIAVESADDGGPIEVTGPRLVVVGDTDFLTDGRLPYLGNRAFALSTLHWLVEQNEGLGIPPRELGGEPLDLSPAQLRWWIVLVVLGLPGGAFSAAFLAWRRRRY